MWIQRQQRSPFKSTDTLIGHGGTLEGKVHCDTNLRIEGSFSGEIHCSGTVTVGEQGTVHASIVAEEIIIAGKVFGDISAERHILMLGSGQIYGNITSCTLSIMEGGLLNGSVSMTEQPAPDKTGGLDIETNMNKKNTRASKQQDSREAG
ncbi:bactofilin family protein [Paenibacillus wynnii]|uniref:bactofilin family protein n=1 Tax=Paenibacillus wynnii TaxID=268407 RepID=UPI00279178CF|nr:polymer-forming cytoskeletal protein [Paenibacillus wynnii]MDQ0194003.1 cytoskeletal protein CcmA (bactofilin family) [Paenibacillus wynnii]